MRVVFDTNVLVSAVVTRGGRGEAALQRIISGRDREQVAWLALFLDEIAEVVDPAEDIHVLMDEPDNRVLECAITGNATTIVSGDGAMLALRSFRGVAIVTLAEYLGGPAGVVGTDE